jgi:hypothetical protein
MKIDLRDIRIVYDDDVTGCPGTHVVVATISGYPMPVGFVWFRHVMVSDLDIVSCFTIDHYRRNGICSALIRKLREWFPKRTMITQSANAQSRPMLKKLGFTQTKNGWYWNA